MKPNRYVCEISPPRMRGRLASIPQFLITLGVVAGYFICYGSVNIPSSLSWRLPFAIHALVAFFFTAITLLFLPHSPRWLAATGRHQEAAVLWDVLGVPTCDREKDENIEINVQELVMGVELSAHTTAPRSILVKEKASAFLRVFQKDVRGRTALGMFLMGMQQLSGIDGVLYVSLHFGLRDYTHGEFSPLYQGMFKKFLLWIQ